jgi:ATP-dependent Clp protease adaptor protein ClpS
MHFSTETKEQNSVELLELETSKFQLMVFNDDVNTFDHVIEALIQVCKHEWIQAEQCTLLIHTNGKTTVKSGELNDMNTMCSALHDRGISASVVSE